METTEALSRSRFAPLRELLLELFKKYPSKSGHNIDFSTAFKAELDLPERLNHETKDALRAHAAALIADHLGLPRPSTRPPAPAPTTRRARLLHERRAYVNGRLQSKFAQHDEVLFDLFQTYQTPSGKNIAVKEALAALPHLKKQLGIKTAQDVRSLEQHTLKLIARQKRNGIAPPIRRRRRKLPDEPGVAEAPTVVAEAPVVASHCWNCGAPQAQVNQAVALLHRLKG